jgi:hypothetical protein
MRTQRLVVIVAIVALVAAAAGWSIAAALKQYQYTGTVTEFDGSAKILKVDKGGEIWEFSTQGLKEMKAKKGDKITVYYQMVAKKVEMK